MTDYATIIESCKLQEERFQFFSLSREDALRLGLSLVEKAVKAQLGI